MIHAAPNPLKYLTILGLLLETLTTTAVCVYAARGETFESNPVTEWLVGYSGTAAAGNEGERLIFVNNTSVIDALPLTTCDWLHTLRGVYV